jgi:hypothetical protein
MYTLSSIKYVAMQNKLWYNFVVPNKPEKKDQPLALRVPISLLRTIEEIAVNTDRPVGYVARELMVRGLSLYRQDGQLRDGNIFLAGSKRGVTKTVTELENDVPFNLINLEPEGEVTDDKVQSRNANKKATRRASRICK